MTKPTGVAALPKPSFPRLSERQRQVYMTAARTFVERGFAATSVGDIAGALGVTKAGLYHYVDSKDALFIDILHLGMDWLEEAVIAPSQAIADPEARLRGIVERHARLTACSDPWITLLLDEIHALPAGQRRKIEDRKRRYVYIIRDLLRALQKAGRLRDVDPTVAAFGAVAMIVWLPRWIRPDGRLPCETVASQTAALALNALLRPQPARVRARQRPAAVRLVKRRR